MYKEITSLIYVHKFTIGKEAHVCKITSKAKDHSSIHMELRIDDMACQLEPGGNVISCVYVN